MGPSAYSRFSAVVRRTQVLMCMCSSSIKCLLNTLCQAVCQTLQIWKWIRHHPCLSAWKSRPKGGRPAHRPSRVDKCCTSVSRKLRGRRGESACPLLGGRAQGEEVVAKGKLRKKVGWTSGWLRASRRPWHSQWVGVASAVPPCWAAGRKKDELWSWEDHAGYSLSLTWVSTCGRSWREGRVWRGSICASGGVLWRHQQGPNHKRPHLEVSHFFAGSITTWCYSQPVWNTVKPRFILRSIHSLNPSNNLWKLRDKRSPFLGPEPWTLVQAEAVPSFPSGPISGLLWHLSWHWPSSFDTTSPALTFPYPEQYCSHSPLEELRLQSPLIHFSLHVFLEAVGVTEILEAVFTFLS